MKRTDDEIRAIEPEQRKLADHLNAISPEDREKQAYGLLCWLQGHEAGYQVGRNAREVENG